MTCTRGCGVQRLYAPTPLLLRPWILTSQGFPLTQALLSQDWFGGMGVLDFLRSVGKHARVNTMMSRESVKQRLARDEGISFTEYVPPSRPSPPLTCSATQSLACEWDDKLPFIPITENVLSSGPSLPHTLSLMHAGSHSDTQLILHGRMSQ